MARSVWKGPFVHEWMIDKVKKAKKEIEEKGFANPIFAKRNCSIIPDFQGLSFRVHNGRAMIQVKVTEYMIGHKFGEFAPTRTFKQHSGDRKKR